MKIRKSKRQIIVSEIRTSLRGHSSEFWQRMVEEMGLQTFSKNSQWWKSVPQSGCGDWKSSIAGG